MITLNIFNSIEYLEPKCPECKTVIEYDVTTVFNERMMAHICRCGAVLE